MRSFHFLTLITGLGLFRCLVLINRRTMVRLHLSWAQSSILFSAACYKMVLPDVPNSPIILAKFVWNEKCSDSLKWQCGQFPVFMIFVWFKTLLFLLPPLLNKQFKSTYHKYKKGELWLLSMFSNMLPKISLNLMIWTVPTLKFQCKMPYIDRCWYSILELIITLNKYSNEL